MEKVPRPRKAQKHHLYQKSRRFNNNIFLLLWFYGYNLGPRAPQMVIPGVNQMPNDWKYQNQPPDGPRKAQGVRK